MSILDVSTPLQIRSDAEHIDPSIVRLLVSEARTGQYFNVALVTVLVYHSIITLDKEIKYFWPNPCSSVSIVYFANRYIGLLGAICNITLDLLTDSLGSCLFSIWTASLAGEQPSPSMLIQTLGLANILLIDYILLIRVLALWHQDRKLFIALRFLLGLEAGLGLGLLVYVSLFEGLTIGSLAEGMTVCVSNRNPPRTLSIISWLVPMTYGLILLCLALYKATEYWKLSSGFKGFHLVRVLIQDQVLYYGFIIFCSVCKIVETSIDEISPFASDVLNVAGSPTLLCILGGQLLINLKEAGEIGLNGGTNYTPRSVSEIDFGENGANEEEISGQEGSVRSTEIELHSLQP